ncbi:DUF6764 family protein [Rhodococcus sp. ARC_M6]|uniref:DUF6764 family protein n=1 Tax=Rhodococcus sp. ARC_M6 TaxID=2928852 RepID=UPI001FB526EC|nr:DUF6764 family protein [Rhodococcus sp. ARC_M6]MCJ0902881.1 protein kinase [Rhodococcus sp. ARC_M6]
MDRRIYRIVASAAGGAAVAASVMLIAGSPASAATLDCAARGGDRNGQDQTMVDGHSACRAVVDPTSSAISHVEQDGIGAADARDGGLAAGFGLFGGVGAAEARGGMLAAFAFGPDSLALGRTTSSPFSVVLSGPGGRAAVGDADVGAICDGGPTLVFNVATGQGCFSDGTSTWTLP